MYRSDARLFCLWGGRLDRRGRMRWVVCCSAQTAEYRPFSNPLALESLPTRLITASSSKPSFPSFIYAVVSYAPSLSWLNISLTSASCFVAFCPPSFGSCPTSISPFVPLFLHPSPGLGRRSRPVHHRHLACPCLRVHRFVGEPRHYRHYRRRSIAIGQKAGDGPDSES
jgi:hypothetical protein